MFWIENLIIVLLKYYMFNGNWVWKIVACVISECWIIIDSLNFIKPCKLSTFQVFPVVIYVGYGDIQ